MMIDRREAIEKSKTMKRTIFYLFCIWGLIVSSAVAQKRTVSHETGTFVGESSAERPERRVSVSPDGVTVTYEFKHAVVLSDPDVADHYLWRISGFDQNHRQTESKMIIGTQFLSPGYCGLENLPLSGSLT